MKTIILSILLLAGSAIAEEPRGPVSPVEATASLDCDHQVPGTSCPVKYSSQIGLNSNTNPDPAPATPGTRSEGAQ